MSRIGVSDQMTFGGGNDYMESIPMAASAGISLKSAAYAPSKQKIQVRKDFPETWLFDGKRADDKDGNAVFSSKIPDTITSWVVSAFAVDKKTGLVVSDDRAKVNLVIYHLMIHKSSNFRFRRRFRSRYLGHSS